MGIKGLLPFLKPAIRNIHISELSGQRCAVDGLCWLHQSLYSCPTSFALGTYSNEFLQFFVGRIDLLLSCKITPIIVFDGNNLPLKQNENEERERTRQENYEKGVQYQREGDLKRSRTYLLASIKITTRMINDVVDVLKSKKIQYLFAPYEADPQLYFLVRNNMVDFVITEDSDSLVYGCSQVLFKLGKDGNGEFAKYSDVLDYIKPMNTDQFQYLCILSGCDFLPSLPGIGIKTAQKIVLTYTTKPAILNKVTSDTKYHEQFDKALFTFHHQTVIDIRTYKCIPLSPYDSIDTVNYDYLGPILSDDISKKVALYLIDPRTKQPFGTNDGQSDTPQISNQSLQASSISTPHQSSSSSFPTTNSISSLFSPKHIKLDYSKMDEVKMKRPRPLNDKYSIENDANDKNNNYTQHTISQDNYLNNNNNLGRVIISNPPIPNTTAINEQGLAGNNNISSNFNTPNSQYQMDIRNNNNYNIYNNNLINGDINNDNNHTKSSEIVDNNAFSRPKKVVVLSHYFKTN